MEANSTSAPERAPAQAEAPLNTDSQDAQKPHQVGDNIEPQDTHPTTSPEHHSSPGQTAPIDVPADAVATSCAGPETTSAQNQSLLPEVPEPNSTDSDLSDHNSKSDTNSSNSCHEENCLPPASADTCVTISPRTTAHFSAPESPSSNHAILFTSPETAPPANAPSPKKTAAPVPLPPLDNLPETAPGETGPAQDNGKFPDAREPVVPPSSDNIACPTRPRAAPRAPRASAPRAKGMRTFVAATARRTFHIARPQKRGPGFAARSPRAHPEAAPAQSSGVNARCGQNLPAGPSHARQKKSQGQHARGGAAPQARDPPRRTMVADLDGVPHVMGGLAEASFGRKDLLFAREVYGDPAHIFNGVTTERHKFFPFPAPDMLESNREFDQELEDARPIFWGFDQEVIDRQVDLYAEQTRIFEQVLGEHDAEFDPAYDRVLYIKEQLTHLNYERQRAITSEYAHKPVMTPQERTRLLAEIAAAERPFLEEREPAHAELTEIIFRGRVQIARCLQKDLRADNEIDQGRARAGQRKVTEEEVTELGVAGAMIGLRGTLKQQSEKTRTEALEFAQRVIDAKMKEFDESDPAYRPRKSVLPAPPRSGPSVDAIVTSIPAWFTILDAKGTVALSAPTPLGRFKQLLHCIGSSSYSAREEQWLRDSRPEKLSPAKEYHEPDDGWPTAKQRARGGWWTCRSGPDACWAERNCELCHSPEAEAAAALEASIDPRAFRDRYQHISDEVEKAMAEANVRDRLMLKHTLEQERQEIERYWQHREWMRSGGGTDILEVLHTPDVNHLNYRPTAGRSQSWQDQVVAESEDAQGTAGEGVVKTERSQSCGEQMLAAPAPEVRLGKQAEEKSYTPQALPYCPRSSQGRSFHGSGP